jgi:hypothetical protein
MIFRYITQVEQVFSIKLKVFDNLIELNTEHYC